MFFGLQRLVNLLRTRSGDWFLFLDSLARFLRVRATPLNLVSHLKTSRIADSFSSTQNNVEPTIYQLAKCVFLKTIKIKYRGDRIIYKILEFAKFGFSLLTASFSDDGLESFEKSKKNYVLRYFIVFKSGLIPSIHDFEPEIYVLCFTIMHTAENIFSPNTPFMASFLIVKLQVSYQWL